MRFPASHAVVCPVLPGPPVSPYFWLLCRSPGFPLRESPLRTELIPCSLPVSPRFSSCLPPSAVCCGHSAWRWLSACVYSMNVVCFFWPCWAFIACELLSRCRAGAAPWLWCVGFSLRWSLLLRSSGSERKDFIVMARGLSS